MTDSSPQIYLEDATEDILTSLMSEKYFPDSINSEENSSEGYIIIHQDNPDTTELLGSLHIRIPFDIDKETKHILEDMKIPTEKTTMVCYGAFDASDPDMGISLNCSVRNEHGYPISYVTDTLRSTMIQINDQLEQDLKKEISEDIKNL